MLRYPLVSTPRSEKDAGVTLVELLVYMVLFALVVTMVASTFISGKRVEKDVSSMTRASNETQLLLAPLEWSVRNAVTVKVAKTDFDGNLLVLKTRVDGFTDDTEDDTWRCEAWFYDEPTKTIYRSPEPAAGSPVTKGLTPGFSLNGWKPTLQRVERTGDAGAPEQIFVLDGEGTGAIINFDTTTSRDKAPVEVNTAVFPRLPEDMSVIGGEDCGDYL